MWCCGFQMRFFTQAEVKAKIALPKKYYFFLLQKLNILPERNSRGISVFQILATLCSNIVLLRSLLAFFNSLWHSNTTLQPNRLKSSTCQHKILFLYMQKMLEHIHNKRWRALSALNIHCSNPMQDMRFNPMSDMSGILSIGTLSTQHYQVQEWQIFSS